MDEIRRVIQITVCYEIQLTDCGIWAEFNLKDLDEQYSMKISATN